MLPGLSISSDGRWLLYTAAEQFEQYVTVALLGLGGMGEVCWARDTESDRPVALKFLCPETTLGFEAEQITREAKAASALNDPNIVTIHEVVHSESALDIVMELIEGSSLGELRGTPLPTAEVLTIGLQIAQALGCGSRWQYRSPRYQTGEHLITAGPIGESAGFRLGIRPTHLDSHMATLFHPKYFRPS